MELEVESRGKDHKTKLEKSKEVLTHGVQVYRRKTGLFPKVLIIRKC